MIKKILHISVAAICLQSQPGWAVPAEGHRLLVAAPSPYAIETAEEIISAGGNVADVAVAIGLTLSVTSPYYAALGGGGFALIRMRGESAVLDFRETAPAKTHENFYADPKNSSIKGGSAVGIPGVPAGLIALHEKYGSLKWQRLFKPALKFAEQGFAVSGEWTSKTTREQEHFSPGAFQVFFKAKKQTYKPGEVLKQKQLAQAIKLLRDKKRKGFYEGPVAQDLVKSVQAQGGVLSSEDLKNYSVVWRKPLEAQWGDYQLLLMPPPSSGGAVIKIAASLASMLKPEKYPALGAEEAHLLGEILSRSYRGRTRLADPAFHNNPFDLLFSSKYIEDLKNKISMKRTQSLAPLSDSTVKESTQTTHYSIMDKDGNAISLTVTLNGNYGSRVVSEKYGIALNNEMDDFTTQPGKPNMYGLIQGSGNLVRPGQRPLSSMSPTIITKDGKSVMAIGAPGGPRIISSVFQVIYRSLFRNMDLDMAIQAPRVHHQFLPHTLYVDDQRWSPEVITALKKKGHKIEPSWMGRVYAVRLKSDGLLEAAFDARGEGSAGGF